MEWFIITIGCVIVLWLLNRWRLRNLLKIINKIPSNKIHTILGFGPIAINLLNHTNKHGDTYGPNSIAWNGPFPFFVTFDPESIKDILTSKKSQYKPAIPYKIFENILQEGLLTNNDPIWSTHRKLFNRSFSYKNIVSFVPIFNQTTDYIIKKIDTITSNGEEIDLIVLFREFALHNSTQTNLKRNLTLTKYDSSYYVNCLNSMLDLLTQITTNRLLDIGILRKLAELTILKKGFKALNEMKQLFVESVELAKVKNTHDPSYLPDVKGSIDYALEGVNQKILNKHEVECEMFNLFMAAFETTATSLYIIIVLLAMYPEIQERAYEEIIDIVPDSEMNHVTLEQIDKMNYLGMIIKESMRVFPAVLFSVRKVTESDFTLKNSITLPKGQLVLIHTYGLHRNKTIWGPNADKFDPDNFLPANIESKDPYAFIPFSQGPRMCLGSKYAQISIKLTLAKLLRAYKFTTDFKYENLEPQFNITLKFVEQPKLQIHRR